jgi:hypothetical protein
MALSLTVKAGIRGSHTKALDLGTADLPVDVLANIALADGTGANQADRIFTDTRTLSASATEDLDLAGSLTDAYGATITLARVKAILVKAASGNTNNVNVSRPASNGVPLFLAASDGIAVLPGGAFLWVAPNAAGVAVTAGTGDLLTFTNSSSGTSVTYDVVIVGASA